MAAKVAVRTVSRQPEGSLTRVFRKDLRNPERLRQRLTISAADRVGPRVYIGRVL